VTRNAECTGHPHSTRLGCGWTGERYPGVKRLRYPGNLWDRPVLTEEYIAAIANKPCPRCGGIVLPIVREGVAWPTEVERP
jgi:hypothetical protein